MGLVWFGLVFLFWLRLNDFCVNGNDKEKGGFGGIYKEHEVDTFYSVVLWAPPRVKRQQRHILVFYYIFFLCTYFLFCYIYTLVIVVSNI